METFAIAVGEPITEDEKQLLSGGLEGFSLLEITDRVPLVALMPPSSSVGYPRHGQPQQLGIDVATILVVTLVSGSAIFAKKIAEEAAKDLWGGIKNLLGRLAKRRKAVPKDSLQVRVIVRVHDLLDAQIVFTCTQARFLSDDVWLAVVRQWQKELNERLTLLRELSVPQLPPTDARYRIILHAVARGGTQPVWHVGEPEQPRSDD